MRSIVEALRFDRLCPRKAAFAAVEHQHMTLDRPRPEADRIAACEHFDPDRVTG
jgi:hypothetical protein